MASTRRRWVQERFASRKGAASRRQQAAGGRVGSTVSMMRHLVPARPGRALARRQLLGPGAVAHSPDHIQAAGRVQQAHVRLPCQAANQLA